MLKRVRVLGCDRSFAPQLAAERGITAEEWERAAHGWAARLHEEPVLGREFRHHFDSA